MTELEKEKLNKSFIHFALYWGATEDGDNVHMILFVTYKLS